MCLHGIKKDNISGEIYWVTQMNTDFISSQPKQEKAKVYAFVNK